MARAFKELYHYYFYKSGIRDANKKLLAYVENKKFLFSVYPDFVIIDAQRIATDTVLKVMPVTQNNSVYLKAYWMIDLDGLDFIIDEGSIDIALETIIQKKKLNRDRVIKNVMLNFAFYIEKVRDTKEIYF